MFTRVRKQAKGGGQYARGRTLPKPVLTQESGLTFELDLASYLDVGLFLDHRITRRFIATQAKGKDVLNLFAYTGSASVYAAAGGAKSVSTVDLSQTYLDWAKRNMAVSYTHLIFSGAQLASLAFAQIPYLGTPLLVVGMVAFSYSTILGWSYYGSRAITYLFGKHAILPYQVLYVAAAFLGAIGIGDMVWVISDIGNALMAIPNIIMVLLLSGLIARETKYYVYDGNLDEEDKTPIPIVESK